MNKKHLLIGLGVAAAAVGVYAIATRSSSSSTGSTTVSDLTPPTITLGSYPTASAQGSPTSSTAPATGSTAPAPSFTPRQGYTRSTASAISAYPLTPFPVGGPPGVYTNPVRRPFIWPPNLRSGAAFEMSPLNPQSVTIAPSVVN